MHHIAIIKKKQCVGQCKRYFVTKQNCMKKIRYLFVPVLENIKRNQETKIKLKNSIKFRDKIVWSENRTRPTLLLTLIFCITSDRGSSCFDVGLPNIEHFK